MHFGPGRVKVRKGPGSGLLLQDETVLDWFRIQNGALGAALPTDHRLAQRKSVTLADLAEGLSRR